MSSIVTNFQAIHNFHKANIAINESKIVFIDRLEAALTIPRVLTVVSSVKSFIDFGSAITSIQEIMSVKRVAEVAHIIATISTMLRPLYLQFTHAEYVLSATVTILDITDFIIKSSLYERKYEKNNLLERASSIILIVGSIFGHIRNANIISLISVTDRFAIQLLGLESGYPQLALGVASVLLDITHTIQKIWKVKSIKTTELLHITAGVLLLTGSTLDYVPIPTVKIISISSIVFGNGIVFLNYYMKKYKYIS